MNLSMIRYVVAASAPLLLLAGSASAAPTVTPPGKEAGDRMAAPPWWYPAWGTWKAGVNVKICKNISVDANTPSENGPPTTVHVNNIDGTDFTFRLDLANPQSVGFWQQLIAACDRADDHEAENYKHRWYKIDMENGGPGVQLLTISGNNNVGVALATIKSVLVPTGKQLP